MANVTLFSGQCSIEYLAINGYDSMYLPVLPFDISNITSSNYSNFTLSVTVNNNAILTDAPFYDATHINLRSGGPRGTIQTYQAGSIGWGIRMYDSTGATINFTTADTVTMTLVGPEEFAPTPGPEPGPTQFILSNVKKIELTRLPIGYTEVDYLYPNSEQGGAIVTNITNFTQGKTFELVVSDLSVLYEPGGAVSINSLQPLFRLYEYYYTSQAIYSGEKYLMLGKNKDNDWILTWGPFTDPKEYYILTSSQAPDSTHKLKITVTRPATNDWRIVIYDMTTESTVFSKTVTDTSTSHVGTISYPPAVVMDGGTTRYARGKVYSIKVTDSNNDLINNLVPAKTASGDTGMYDTINCVFLHTQRSTRNPEHVNVPVGPDASTPATLLEVIKIEDYYNGVLRTLWSKPSEPGPTPSTAEPLTYDDTIVWTVGTGVANSNGYYYYPLTANGETGVQIALTDNPLGWNSDGKPTMNTEYSWKVKFPSAGWYQMVVTAGYSSSGANATFASYNYVNIDGMGGVSSYYSYYEVDPTSNLDIQVYTNSQGSDYDAPGILVVPYCAYSSVPNFVMTQGGATPTPIVLALVYIDDATVEHTITYKSTSYRLVFDTSSNIVFRKLNNYTPPANPNS